MPTLFTAIAGAAIVSILYGLLEARIYRTKSHRLEILPPGSQPLRVLQVSDLHLRPKMSRLAHFVEELGREKFDVVLATGDLLGGVGTIERTARVLNSLDARFGKYFVLGSSDYYAPKFKGYLDYFVGRRRHSAVRLDTSSFKGLLTQQGWVDLTNVDHLHEWAGLKVQITGLDDPYLKREDRSLLRRKPEADVAICVVHDPAPYDEAAAAGYDLIISGHTHGGQVRFPFIGAVVTNSTLPTDRARWTTEIGDAKLFVNPGLGTGKYAPFRFLSPPEASILELVARKA